MTLRSIRDYNSYVIRCATMILRFVFYSDLYGSKTSTELWFIRDYYFVRAYGFESKYVFVRDSG